MYTLLQVLHQFLVENTYQNPVILYLTSSDAAAFNGKHLSKLCIYYLKCYISFLRKTLVKAIYVYLTSSAATVFNGKHLSKLCIFYFKCHISFWWKTLDKAMYLLVQIRNISGIKTARERYLGETYQDEG